MMRTSLSSMVMAAVLAWPSAARAEQPDAMTTTMQELYEAGANAAAQKDWETCRAKLTAAWALGKHQQLAAQLGMCESELGLHAEAAEHLAYYIEHLPPETPPEQKSYAQGLFDSAATHIAIVYCGKSFAGAEVRVDDKGHGNAPLTLYLSPGPHALAASKGDESWSATVTFKAGEKRELTVTLKGGGAPKPPEVEDEGPSTALVAVGYSLAGAALGVAVGLTVAAASEDSDIDALAEQLDAEGGSCPDGATNPICADMRDAADGRGTLSAVAGVAWGVGGAALIATTVYFFAGGSSSGGDTATSARAGAGAGAGAGARVRFEPRVDAQGGGVWFQGAF